MSPEIVKANSEFKEVIITGNEPAWCVDGRAPNEIVAKGPQMLGGSLHMVLLEGLANGKTLNAELVDEVFGKLKNAGFGLGVHTDEHAHGGAVGCGFAQNIRVVFQKMITNKKDIIDRLQSIYEGNKTILGEMDFAGIIVNAYDKITAYSQDNLQLTGKSLVEAGQNHGATLTTLAGEHGEQAGFVNLKRDTSYDTINQAKEGKQAFNLDLWAVQQQAEALGVDKNFTLGASLILYQATALVLADNQQKPPPQIFIHA